jgi:TonB family protein
MRRCAIGWLLAAAACGSPPYVPPPASPQRIYANSEIDEPPQIVLAPPLESLDLPWPALRGVALVRVVVDPAGNPEPATALVLETPDSLLGVAARALVAKTLFRPARLRGRPVQVALDLAVAFSPAASPPASVHLLDEVYTGNEVQERPHPTYTPPLAYPGPLLLAGIQGRVIVQAVVDTLGRVEEGTLVVVETADARFNEAAKEFVRRSRFAPGRIAGRAVRVRVQLPVEFRRPSRS